MTVEELKALPRTIVHRTLPEITIVNRPLGYSAFEHPEGEPCNWCEAIRIVSEALIEAQRILRQI